MLEGIRESIDGIYQEGKMLCSAYWPVPVLAVSSILALKGLDGPENAVLVDTPVKEVVPVIEDSGQWGFDVLPGTGNVFKRYAPIELKLTSPQSALLSESEFRGIVQEDADVWNEVLTDVDSIVRFNVSSRSFNSRSCIWTPSGTALNTDTVSICLYGPQAWAEHEFFESDSSREEKLGWACQSHFLNANGVPHLGNSVVLLKELDEGRKAVKSVLLHELGHVLGLVDLYDGVSDQNIMNGYSAVYPQLIDSGTRAGIQRVYGAHAENE